MRQSSFDRGDLSGALSNCIHTLRSDCTAFPTASHGCEGVARFEQEYMGRGPKDIHAHWSATCWWSACTAC
jgi:hypothetical protein